MPELASEQTITILDRVTRIRPYRLDYETLQRRIVPLVEDALKEVAAVRDRNRMPPEVDAAIRNVITTLGVLFEVLPGQVSPKGGRLEPVSDGTELLMRLVAHPQVLMDAAQEVVRVLVVSSAAPGPVM